MTKINHLPVINLSAGDVPDAPVQLNCCPVTLNPLEPGDMLTITQMDSQDPSLQLELSATVYGPIMFDGREVVEVHRTTTLNGVVQRKEVHWIGREEEQIRCRLREVRPLAEEGSADRVESIESGFPKEISISYEGIRKVEYRQGSYTGTEEYSDRVTGIFQVNVDTDGFGECICLETTRTGDENRRIETYIQVESGLVVLTRMFKGSDLSAIQIVRWGSQ